MKAGPKRSISHHLLAVALIGVFTVILHGHTLDVPFVFDDIANIRDNPHIRLSDRGNMTLSDALSDALSKSPLSNRPVANLSFALNYLFGKYDVTGYHVVNTVIHLINGVLVYFLALVVFRQAAPLGEETGGRGELPFSLMALFAALVFVGHPVQVQSVTYVVQRMNSMAALFYFAALLCYIHGRRHSSGRGRWILFSSAFLSWLLALGSKEIAVTLPVVILLYEWYFFQDLRIDWVKRNVKAVVGVGVVLALLVFIYMGDDPMERILSGYRVRDFTLSERLLTQLRVVGFYMSLMFFPHPARLNLLHQVSISQSLVAPATTLISCFVILGLIGLAVFLARRERLLSFSIFWWFITLALESSVLGLEMVFEHRLYLPAFGVVLSVSLLLFRGLRTRVRAAWVVSAVVVVALGTGTYSRNQIWKDEGALWRDVLAKNPQSFRAHTNLGKALAARGNTDEAVDHYGKALAINPTYIVAHYNLGLLLAGKGRTDEAIHHYESALAVKPRYAKVLNSLGAALDKKGRLEEAIERYEKALRIDPADMKTHNNLGVALGRQGRIDEAIGHLSQALRIDPSYADAHNNLGILLFRQGDRDGAVRHFREALRIDPFDKNAKRNLERITTGR